MMKSMLFIGLFFIAYSSSAETPVYSSPYEKRNYVDDAVKEFLDKRECYNIEKKLNRDVLGRRNSSDNETKIQQCVEQKMSVEIISLDFSENEVEPISARYENDRFIDRYFIDGKLISEKDFFARVKSLERNDYKVPYQVRTLTAGEIEHLLLNENHIGVSKYLPIQEEDNDDGPYVDYNVIFGLSEVSTYAHANGYDGDGIGIMFREVGKPKSNCIEASRYQQIGLTTCNVKGHATGVASILQKTAPGSKIYGVCDTTYMFPNPDAYDPAIEVATHSWSVFSSSNPVSYISIDAAFDNYIYNHRVITFVAAGNHNTSMTSYRVKDPGKALNVITVGAVSPTTNEYKRYSHWTNPNIGYQKPEVANYTDFALTGDPHFYFGDGNYYVGALGGTSAATPYTAAMAADILEQHPFFKRHPEAFKALILTGSMESIAQANLHDRDNDSLVATSVPMYSFMAWDTRSAYWNGANGDYFDSNEEIVFTESGIEAGKNYKIAISWLVPGSYVLQNRVLSQDMDLFVYQNDSLIASSTFSQTPFEIVSFVTATSGDLVVKIRRVSNSGVGDVILGYNMLKVN